MSLEIEGVEELLYRLEQTGVKAIRGAAQEMRKGAEDIARLAKLQAPIDEGFLEEAIKVRATGGERDELGRFGRIAFEVYVDEDMPADGNTTVGDYAYRIHEWVTPYGDLNLGPRSREKQMALGGEVLVGGGYLERAVQELEPVIRAAMLRKVRNVL